MAISSKVQASVREELVPDRVGTDEKTHKAGVGSCGLRPIADDDPHLLAGTLEAGGNGQRCHLPIAFGLRLLDRLSLFGCLTEAPTDPILIQNDIDAVSMDLDAHDA